MKDIWEALPSKQLALFEKIKPIPMADGNYRRLRSYVRREKARLERLELLSHHIKDVDPALFVGSHLPKYAIYHLLTTFLSHI